MSIHFSGVLHCPAGLDCPGRLLLFVFIIFLTVMPGIYAGDKPLFYHTDDNIEIQAARFPLGQPCVLKSVKITFSGNSANSTCRIRIFGAEGGGSYPFYEMDLTDPIVLRKSKRGMEEILVSLPNIEIKSSQFFIAVDSLGEGIFLCTDNRKIIPECVSNDEVFTYQSVKYKDGSWFLADSYYHITPEIEPLYEDIESIFTDVSVDTFPNDSLLNDENIVVFDYNDDNLPDIILNRKLFRNHGNMVFTEEKSVGGFLDGASRVLASDINSDGKYEILAFPELGNSFSVIGGIGNPGIHADSIFLNAEFRIKSVRSSDLNNDGKPDIVILRENPDSTIASHLVMMNEGDYKFREYILQAAGRGRCSFISDINDDGYDDIYIVNENSEDEIWLTGSNENAWFFNKIDIDLTDGKANISTRGSRNVKVNGSEEGEKEMLILTETGQMIDSRPLSTFISVFNSDNNFISDADDIEFEEQFTGAQYLDIDNDGRQDIVLSSALPCRHAAVYRRNESGRLENISWQSGFNRSNLGEDILCEDLDMDGRTDIISACNGRLLILKNEMKNDNNYLNIRSVNKNIKSARVFTESGEYYSEGNSKTGIKKQRSGLLHVGIGASETVDSLIVLFDDGSQKTERGGNVNSIIEIADDENSGEALRFSMEVYPNPFRDKLNVRLYLPGSNNLMLGIYDMNGKLIREINSGMAGQGTEEYEWNSKESGNMRLAPGLYIIKASFGGIELIKKIIKIEE